MSMITEQRYTIHGNTIFIAGNGITSQYIVHGDNVSKLIQHYSGDEMIVPFHNIGELATNTEAMLINKLRKEGEI